MNPRGRPFEPGNKMGRGRPRGSRNKSTAAVQQLLEQSQLPVVHLIIRQALQGDHHSQRLLMTVYPSLPRKRACRSRLGKIHSLEDLMSATEETTQQMSRGEMTPEEANATMKGLEQMGHLLKQQDKLQKSQLPLKTPLPEFMIKAIEGARADRIERDGKAKNERDALESARGKPP